MSFGTILKELSRHTNAHGAILLDWEGEMVDSFSNSKEFELDIIGAHKGLILNMLKEVSAKTSDGDRINHVSISTEKAKLSISPIKDGYYVVVILDKTRPLGKTIYESKKAVAKIEEEMG